MCVIRGHTPKGVCFLMIKKEIEKTSHEPRKGRRPSKPRGEGTPNQGKLQSYIQNFTKEAIDKIVWFARSSKNENLRFAANKLIIDKSIADIKAMELTGAHGEQLTINIVTRDGFIPPSMASAGGPAPVQSLGVAQTVTENLDSAE